MQAFRVELAACWLAWAYPFVFRAPHFQKRDSITVSGPTLAGLFFEILSFLLAYWLRFPAPFQPGAPRVIFAGVFGLLAAVVSWTSVAHLGRQFRIRAGLYADHQLIRTGPYSIVRHPIYASVLCLLLCSLLDLTPWRSMLLPLASFVLGTEIRVRCEDRLLASRFGDEFREYQRSVRAYVPLLR
jgi:protein-S-isoprenylcysteine O-methyltransferase Ste14